MRKVIKNKNFIVFTCAFMVALIVSLFSMWLWFSNALFQSSQDIEENVTIGQIEFDENFTSSIVANVPIKLSQQQILANDVEFSVVSDSSELYIRFRISFPTGENISQSARDVMKYSDVIQAYSTYGEEVTYDELTGLLEDGYFSNVYVVDNYILVRKNGSTISLTDFPIYSDYYHEFIDSGVPTAIQTLVSTYNSENSTSITFSNTPLSEARIETAVATIPNYQKKWIRIGEYYYFCDMNNRPIQLIGDQDAEAVDTVYKFLSSDAIKIPTTTNTSHFLNMGQRLSQGELIEQIDAGQVQNVHYMDGKFRIRKISSAIAFSQFPYSSDYFVSVLDSLQSQQVIDYIATYNETAGTPISMTSGNLTTENAKIEDVVIQITAEAVQGRNIASATVDAIKTSFPVQYPSEEFTITYKGLDGTETLSTATAHYGQSCSVFGFTNPENGQFVGWNTAKDGAGALVNPKHFNQITENLVLYPQINYDDLTISISTDGNGVITPINVSDSWNVGYGQNQTFVITPNLGYEIDSIIIDGSDVVEVTVNPGQAQEYVFVNVQRNQTIYATFVQRKFTVVYKLITLRPETGQNNETTTVFDNLAYNSSKSITIETPVSHKITNVLLNGISQAITATEGNTQTISIANIKSDQILIATISTRAFDVAVTQTANGTISPASPTVVYYGVSKTFNISGNSGYYVSSVSSEYYQDGSLSSSTSNNFNLAQTTHTFAAVTPAAGHTVSFTITATYLKAKVSVYVSPNTTYYNTLESAMSFATGKTATVTVLESLSVASAIVFDSSSSGNIKLNAASAGVTITKSFSGSDMIQVVTGSTLTLTIGEAGGVLTFYKTTSYPFLRVYGGTTNLKGNARFTGTSSGFVAVQAGATVNNQGASITQSSDNVCVVMYGGIFNMSSGTITNASASSNTAVYVNNAAALLNISGGTISSSSVAVNVGAGSLSISGGTIKTTSTTKNAIIFVGTTLSMSGSPTISVGTSSTYAGLSLSSGKYVTLTNAFTPTATVSVSMATAANGHKIVYSSDASRLNVSKFSIINSGYSLYKMNNHIYAINSSVVAFVSVGTVDTVYTSFNSAISFANTKTATVTMIKSCTESTTSTLSSGNITIVSASTYTVTRAANVTLLSISGATVTIGNTGGNLSFDGGNYGSRGIQVTSGTVTLGSKLTITRNGNHVYMSGGSVDVNGATMTNSIAGYSAVDVEGGTLTLNSGSITGSGNYGIYSGAGSVVIKGGTISTASSGGVRILGTPSTTRLVLSGAPAIQSIYLDNDCYATLTSALTSSSSIPVAVSWPRIGARIAYSATTAYLSNSSTKFSISAHPEYSIALSGSYLVLSGTIIASVTVGSTTSDYPSIKTAFDYALSQTTSTVTLKANTSLVQAVTIASGKNVTFIADSTARTLSRGFDGAPMFTVSSGGTLVVGNSGNTLSMQGGYTASTYTNGNNHCIDNYGTTTLSSHLAISGNRGNGLKNSGTATIAGCNLSSSYSSNIWNLASGVVTMTSGTIQSSIAYQGVANDTGATFTMSGGTITGNNLNGINNNGTTTISGGTIQSSSSYYSVNNNGTFNLSGSPTISKIYLTSGKYVTLNNGALSNTYNVYLENTSNEANVAYSATTSWLNAGKFVISSPSNRQTYVTGNYVKASKTYQITINPQGGVYTGSTSVTQRYGTSLQIPYSTKKGYTFGGWLLSGGGTYSETKGGLILSSESNEFASVSAYDNNNSGKLTKTIVNDSGAPNGCAKVLRLTNTGAGTQPDLGGYYHMVSPSLSNTYYHVIVAKIPVGYTLNNYNNSLSGTCTWLTARAGTGSWQVYIYRWVVSASGNTGTFGHMAISGTAGSTSNPVVWEVAVNNIYNTTSNAGASVMGQYTFSDAGLEGTTAVTLTAQWTPTVYSIKYVANGGYDDNNMFAATSPAWDTTFETGSIPHFENQTDGGTYAVSSEIQFNGKDNKSMKVESNGGINRIYRVVPIQQNQAYSIGFWYYSTVVVDNALHYEINDSTYYTGWGGASADYNTPGQWQYLTLNITSSQTSLGNTNLYFFVYATTSAACYVDDMFMYKSTNTTNPLTYTIETPTIYLNSLNCAGNKVFTGWTSDTVPTNSSTVTDTIANGSVGNKTLYARFNDYSSMLTTNYVYKVFPNYGWSGVSGTTVNSAPTGYDMGDVVLFSTTNGDPYFTVTLKQSTFIKEIRLTLHGDSDPIDALQIFYLGELNTLGYYTEGGDHDFTYRCGSAAKGATKVIDVTDAQYTQFRFDIGNSSGKNILIKSIDIVSTTVVASQNGNTSLEVTPIELPSNYSISYLWTNNSTTNVSTYNVSVTGVSAKCTLTFKKGSTTIKTVESNTRSVTINKKLPTAWSTPSSFTYDGSNKSVSVVGLSSFPCIVTTYSLSGTRKNGTSVSQIGNSIAYAGNYTVNISVSYGTLWEVDAATGWAVNGTTKIASSTSTLTINQRSNTGSFVLSNVKQMPKNTFTNPLSNFLGTPQFSSSNTGVATVDSGTGVVAMTYTGNHDISSGTTITCIDSTGNNTSVSYHLDTTGLVYRNTTYPYHIGGYIGNDSSVTFQTQMGLSTISSGLLTGATYAHAFSYVYSCSSTYLTTIIIGTTINTIRAQAFDGCSELLEFQVSSGNTYFSIDQKMLYNFNQTTLIRCPLNFHLGTNFLNIIYLPNSVTTISARAMYNCQFHYKNGNSSNIQLYFQNTISSLGSWAFMGASIMNYNFVDVANGTVTTFASNYSSSSSYGFSSGQELRGNNSSGSYVTYTHNGSNWGSPVIS